MFFLQEQNAIDIGFQKLMQKLGFSWKFQAEIWYIFWNKRNEPVIWKGRNLLKIAILWYHKNGTLLYYDVMTWNTEY